MKEKLKNVWYLFVIVAFILLMVLGAGYNLFNSVSVVMEEPSTLIYFGILILVIVWISVIEPKMNLAKKTERLQWIKSNLNLDFITSKGVRLVDKEYRILTQDEQYEKKIFGLFMERIEKIIYNNDMKKEFKRLSDEEYAMYFLYSFLCSLDERYDGISTYDTCDDIMKYYKLTEYGEALHRILYICCVYCGKNENIVKYITHHRTNGENVKEILDNGYITYFK